MKDIRVKIGLAGVVHPNMPGDDDGVYAGIVQAMEALKKEQGFDLAALLQPLRSEADGEAARKFFDDHQVDLTLIFNASLGYGRVILPLARVNSYIGLWSIPEPTKDGVLQLNSFCGLNMYGSIISNYLSLHRIPFKWFYGYTDAPMFVERFRVTLAALKAIKALKQSRIGQIGGLADGFENMYIDERELEKKFGTYLQTRHTVEDIVSRARTYDDALVRRTLELIEADGQWNRSRVTPKAMEKFARVNRALEDFAAENRYDALCISCWSKFQKVYGLAVCGAMSRLNESGIVTACEGDVPAAVNMLVFNALNGQKAALKDLVSIDEDDDSINLWHCGVAPKCWANHNGVTWDEHFNIGQYGKDGQWQGRGVVADLSFKPGTITVCSMNNRFDNLFILTGEVMPQKKSYYGSSGWINNLAVNGQKISLPDLINTISVGRLNHHYPVAFGDLTSELNEFAAWKGLTVLEPIAYRPYLQVPPNGLNAKGRV